MVRSHPSPCRGLALKDVHERQVERVRAELEVDRLRSQELRCHFTAETCELKETAERDRQLLAERLHPKWEQRQALGNIASLPFLVTQPQLFRGLSLTHKLSPGRKEGQGKHFGMPRPALSGVPRAVQAPPCAAGTVNPRQEPCPGRGKLWGAAFQLGSLTLPKLCSGSRAFCLTPPG